MPPFGEHLIQHLQEEGRMFLILHGIIIVNEYLSQPKGQSFTYLRQIH